ncbi:MAG: tetratricopeptide repeat protein [Candidatus Omnitrophica bacterium]|nr:tetratricopeptide repeat protein [Candidatus Omnitrophota bacterium]
MSIFIKLKEVFVRSKFIFSKFWIVFLFFLILFYSFVNNKTNFYEINDLIDKVHIEEEIGFYISEGTEIESERLQKAIWFYDLLGEAIGFDEYVLGNIAACYFCLGDYKDSIKFYDKAIAINPRLYTFYFDKAIVNMRLQEYEKSLELFGMAFRQIPATFKYYFDFFKDIAKERRERFRLEGRLWTPEKVNSLLSDDFYFIEERIKEDLVLMVKELNKIALSSNGNSKLQLEAGELKDRIELYQRTTGAAFLNAESRLEHDSNSQGAGIVHFNFQNFRTMLMMASLIDSRI